VFDCRFDKRVGMPEEGTILQGIEQSSKSGFLIEAPHAASVDDGMVARCVVNGFRSPHLRREAHASVTGLVMNGVVSPEPRGSLGCNALASATGFANCASRRCVWMTIISLWYLRGS